MKRLVLVLLSICCLSSVVLNAQCLEVTSIFANACTEGSGTTNCTQEGPNEMFTFEVGATDLFTGDISVAWPNNTFQNWCNDATTALKTDSLNATILSSCGWLLEPLNDTLPANSNVIVITSEDFCVTANSFEGLADTMYILYQCSGNTAGHFANNPGGTRTLTVTVANGCVQSESVSYDGAIPNADGATALYDAAGNVTYAIFGCNAPVITLSAGWSFQDVCTDYGIVDLNSLLAPNATTGGTWSGPRVTGSNYDPTGYLGLDSATYSVTGNGACTETVDSTIVFLVEEPQTGAATVQGCDSVFVNGTWYSSSTMFTDTIMAGNPFACDSFTNYTIVIDNAITDSIYLASCDSVQHDGTWYTADIILRDTVFAMGGGPIVIDTILETGFEDAEGWNDHSSGNWTETDAYGTWNAVGMYANQFNPNNGARNIGMNTVGDYLELPPVSNPQTMYYYDRLSSAPSGTNELAIEYFDGTTWQTLGTDICTHLTYELVTTDLTAISGLTNVSLRIFRTQDDRSAYIDDIVIVGSTSSSGSTCDSIFITNIDVLNPVSSSNPGNPFLICATNDSVQLPGGAYATSAGNYSFTFNNGASNGCDSTVNTIVQVQNCGCFFDDASKTFWIKADTLMQNGGGTVTTGTTDQWGNIVNNALVPNLNGLAGGGTRTIVPNDPDFNFNSTIDFAGAGFNRGGLPNNAILNPSQGSMFVVSTQSGLSFNFAVGTASTGTCGGNRCSSGFRGDRSEFGSANDLFIGTTQAGVANVIGMSANTAGPVQKNAINGIVGNSAAADPIPASTATVNYAIGVGVWPGFVMTGQVAEAIAFNRELALDEFERIESYLALKYGTTLSHSYYASDYSGATGTTTFIQGLGYDNDIAGLGRDDCFSLEQIKSHSVNPNAIVTMALTDNGGTYANPNVFDNNLEFLMWGNNGATATFACSTNTPTGFNQLYNRIWLSQQSGVVGNTDIAFNLTNAGLTGAASDYALVLDTDGDGDYSDETALVGTIVGSELLFTGVNLDNFTFTLVQNSVVNVTVNDQICNNGTYTLPNGTIVSSPGTYMDTITGTATCDSIITTNLVGIVCNCNFDLGNDTSFCAGSSLLLDAGAGFDTYVWQDNSMNQTFNVSTTGSYYCAVSYLDSSNNLVVNGDFEQGNTGFTTDYGPPSGGRWNLNEGEYEIATVSSHSNLDDCTMDHTPTGVGNMMIVNGSNTPNTSVWCQNVVVSPNTEYLFSAWAMSLENTNAANVATLHFLIDGTQIGPNFSPSFTQCDWQQFNTSWNSGVSTNIQICIESDVIAGNNDYALDDIFFTPICNYTDTIDVTVNPIPTPNIGPDLVICQGQDTLLDATTANATYLWQDGTTTTSTLNASAAGTYWVDLTVNNCTARDSMELTVNSVFTSNTTESICAGDSAFLGNAWQTTAGVYNDTYTSAGGCDSSITTTLMVISVVTNNEVITVCSNELPVVINGNAENQAGTYSDTISSSLGCDSIVSNTELVVNPLPVVSLGADTTIDEGSNLTLSVINPNNNETYTWTNNLGANFAGSSIQANNMETAEYYLTATNQFNCLGFDSLLVVVNPLDETLLLVPSAFSPNGDGVNDIFRVANYDQFESYILRVYNRWGELIFDNQGYNSAWNGSYKGKAQNVGVYTFYIEAKPLNGAAVMKTSGNFALIR